MRPTSRVVPVLLALLLVTFTPALKADQPTSCKPGVVFQNGDVRVWFQGKKDLFKVFDANGSDDAGGSRYQYQARAIEERDAEGNVVATMNLERAFPQTSSCAVTTEGGFVNMSLLVTDSLEGRAGEATVGFTFHFDTSSHGGKFDLDVARWPWAPGENHTLDFGFALDASGWSVEPAGDGVGFRDSNGTAHGYVSWAPNATARYADGHEENATVNGTVAAAGSHADVSLAFTNVTSGYDELVYDPWMGSGDYLVVAGHLVGLAPVEDALPRGLTGSLHALL